MLPNGSGVEGVLAQGALVPFVMTRGLWLGCRRGGAALVAAALVLACGVDTTWLNGGVAVEEMPPSDAAPPGDSEAALDAGVGDTGGGDADAGGGDAAVPSLPDAPFLSRS